MEVIFESSSSWVVTVLPFFYVGAGLSLALTSLRQQPATALIAVD